MKLVTFLLLFAVSLSAHAQEKKKQRANTPPPVKPPLVAADISTLPEGTDRLDLYLLIGQSNMKGRGHMPEEPRSDPRIVMMHLRTDQWFNARHPLHLVGDPETFKGHDNAGVGPGLAFADAVAKAHPGARIGLIPCAKGGTSITLWKDGAKLYTEAIRRTKLALQEGPEGKTKLKGVLWLQGEADSPPQRMKNYAAALNDLVDRLRKDLDDPDLPFLAATIGEIRPDTAESLRSVINEILIDLPNHRENTATVDARDLKGHIGDNVHYDTASQEEIGRRFAKLYLEMEK